MFSTSDADFCRTLCFTTDCTYFDAYYFIRCWPNWMFCSFIQTVHALFLSPSSNTYRVRCFAHLQQVPDLPRISLYLMLIMSCILPAYRSYVLRFDTLSIRCWLIVRCLFRWLDVCALFLISFCLRLSHLARPQVIRALLQCSLITFWLNWTLCFSTDCMCFDSMLLSFYANYVYTFELTVSSTVCSGRLGRLNS